jgi:hypothetical protein
LGPVSHVDDLLDEPGAGNGSLTVAFKLVFISGKSALERQRYYSFSRQLNEARIANGEGIRID